MIHQFYFMISRDFSDENKNLKYLRTIEWILSYPLKCGENTQKFFLEIK